MKILATYVVIAAVVWVAVFAVFGVRVGVWLLLVDGVCAALWAAGRVFG